MIRLECTKDEWNRTDKFFRNVSKAIRMLDLKKYGQQGVEALTEATVKDTGLTSQSWYYDIERGRNFVSLTFSNSNIQNGYNVAILLEYGHATRNGMFIEGLHYIDPVIIPIFEEIANNIFREVMR